MTSNLDSQNDLKQIDENLAESFYTGGRYNALFLGVAGIGFAVIYLLAQYGVLGEAAPSLLSISLALLFMTVAQLFTMFLARRKKGISAHLLNSLFTALFAIFVTFYWEGFVYIAVVLVLIPPFTSIRAGMPNRYRPHLYILVIVGIAGILGANANPSIDSLRTNTVAAIASLTFLGATGLLLFTVILIVRSKNYRSLRNQLLTSFIIIVTIPILMSTVLSAIGAYINNQSQTFNTLGAISDLKLNQTEELINGFKNDITAIQLDVSFERNVQFVLASSNLPLYQQTEYHSLVRTRLAALQSNKEFPYREIMVLNSKGTVEVSTNQIREGNNYQSEPLFQSGSTGTFVGFSDDPAFFNGNLFISQPIYAVNEKNFLGVLVLRADDNLIKNIMETTPGFEEAETYLLDKNFQPVTKTRTPVNVVRTDASLNILQSNAKEGSGIYENYAGETVIGVYRWIEPLQMVFITETPLSTVLNNTLNSTASSVALALFAIIIAVAAVAISADSISNPISALAETTKSFAAGKLSARAAVELNNEIGDLGRAYNQMAEQLQNVIGRLEQRVGDRTRELESQSNRLRVAAEIARDAASSRNLTELLEQAGALIQERFGFYHTGIFLLDNNREYAVLTSSPTKVGKEMIANNHKLRVGEMGIVGRVAATGEPRISLDTGLDATHFNNPLLPHTRSEMAIPLKVQNSLIGVLDVQSDQPQAFHDDDVAITQLMADQLATAIERARLLQQVEQNLNELEQAYGNFTREGWRALGQSGLLSNAGYRFDNVRIQSINELPALGSEAIRSGNTVVNANGKKSQEDYTVAIPIKLRGQAIGAVTVKLKEGYTQTTISTIELAIERLAASLESARLYEEARVRADREQSISHVTTAISSSTEYEEILRTTIREIGNIFNDTEVAIQILDDPNEKRSGG